MARPRNADATVTRGRILAAARALFADRGLSGASTRDIARTAGVSVATLHHYFGSKEALHHAATNDMWAGMGSVHKAFVHAIEDDDDLATLVDKCVRVAFAYSRENRDAVRMLMRRVIERGAIADIQDQTAGTATDRPDVLETFITNAATLLSAATGRSAAKARLELSSVVFLVIRYALADLEHLAALLKVDMTATNDDEFIEALEDHLVEATLRILAVERPAS